MAAMTNAQRQQRFRERHKTGDLFPPAVTPAVTASVTPAVTASVTPSVTAVQSLVASLPCRSVPDSVVALVSVGVVQDIPERDVVLTYETAHYPIRLPVLLCPFCGEVPALSCWKVSLSEFRYELRCSGCGVNPTVRQLVSPAEHYSLPYVLSRWNRRFGNA